MLPKRRRSLAATRWQVASVVIACIGLLWSIAWGISTRFASGSSFMDNWMQTAPISSRSTPASSHTTSVPTTATASTQPGMTFMPPSLPASPTASQTRGCYSISCDGQPPEKYGCVPDQVLVASIKLFHNDTLAATVEFYVSQACSAGWINIETPLGTTGNLSAEVNNGGYVQQYCYPHCPVQRYGQPDRQNVHTVMIHTNQNYLIWGRGCYFPQSGQPLCFPNINMSEFEFSGFW